MIHWDRILQHLTYLLIYTLAGVFPGVMMGIGSACIIYVGRVPHYFRWDIVIICTILFGLYGLFFGIKDIMRDYF
jgi:hypothetical protein